MFKYIILILSLFVFTACNSGSSGGGKPDGQVQTLSTGMTDLGVMTVQEIASLKNSFAPNGEKIAPTRCGVHAYKVSYTTVDVQGKTTTASGLVAVPTGVSQAAMVSYQHGTSASRNDVPSRFKGSMEALFTVALYGGGCHIVVEADYLGLGDNPGFHPYLHADTEGSAAADLILAVVATMKLNNNFGVAWNQQLFLAGYSQGGHATMAVHRTLEQRKIKVTASAPMAGPYDLSNSTIREALRNPSPSTSTYAAYIIFAFNHIYGSPVYQDVLIAPYDQKIDVLFDGTQTNTQVASKLPQQPSGLLQNDFIQEILRADESPFRRLLEKNDLYTWNPKAPIKLYHGTADRDVPFANADVAYNFMRSHGAQIELVNLGAVDHGGGFMPALLGSYQWFNSLSGN